MMLYTGAISIGVLFAYIFHCHFQLIILVNGGDVAMNCGSVVNSTALYGREWVGESVSASMSGKSRSSAADQTPLPGVDPVPYRTSRISAAEFHYTFHLNPGQKLIRLHFYPASYRGFERSLDYFSVKAGPFTLLRDYSASLTADTLGVKYIVKEFCLNVEENGQLKMTFSPSQKINSKNDVYAFVNGIEIISTPTGLYYTPEREIGVPIVGLSDRFYIIDNSTALEVVQRFNIGGSSITSVEDFGLFRQWNEDANYLLESAAHRVNHLPLKIKYTNMPAFIAPPKIFQTSWKSGRRKDANGMYNFRWKVPVDLGFGYVVRLHFCDLDSMGTEVEQREFSVLINKLIAETKANVISWSGGTGIPVYRDYVIILKGDVGSSKSELLIGLEAVDQSVFQLLNGLEIFKLSDLNNNLAAPNLVFPVRISTSRNLKIKNLSLAFGQSNVIGTVMTVLIVVLSTVMYKLRKFWEENFHDGKDAESASSEPSSYCFSLADIKLATQNFSDELIIGRGGFGKVYKGLIPGVAKTLAIKRLNPDSRQGAHEFWTEIETLSKLRHFHLVSLIGYCNECQEMILVYEYMPCGTLADNLYKLRRIEKECTLLTWEQRLRICIGAARGLEYLHTGCEYGVIHRDVKDTNILLDENFVAKISDFGLSKLEKITHSQSYVSTKVKGTVGYLDPDYFMTYRLTRKSDVYSFGVVMLVILSGKPAVDNRILGKPQSLLSCFRECIAEGDFSRIVDPCLQGEISFNRISEFVKIVKNCLQQTPKRRPTMTQVVADLEHLLEQHGVPLGFASAHTTVAAQAFEEGNTQSFHLQLEAPLEESVISPPNEGIVSKQTETLAASPTRGKDLQSTGQDYSPVRKPIWVWPWKAVQKRGNKEKAEDVRVYSYETLAAATHNFDPENRLDYGYRVEAYKGVLLNGQEVVVERLSESSNLEKLEFRNEVLVMCELQHHNIVRLLGCSFERLERMLVHEYTPNGYGSLDAYLSDSKMGDLLDWNRRKIIIEGIARGLLYLHEGSNVKVIHGYLMPSKILLDKELKPKIFGFDIARIQKRYPDPTTTLISRTCDYMAPEYLVEGLLLEKSDVYSYGLLLLEIINGKIVRFYLRNYQNLLEWAWKLWNENEMIKLVDPAILCPDIEREILRYIHVALLCLQPSAEDRPEMSTLLSMLKNETAELPQPKLQGYFARLDSADCQSFLLPVDSVNDGSSTTFEANSYVP